MSLKEILDSLNTLSLSDLRVINREVVAVLKSDRKVKNAAIKRTLSVGDNVSFSGKYGPCKGVITKINRTRCKVKGSNHWEMWSVPMTMLTKTNS